MAITTANYPAMTENATTQWLMGYDDVPKQAAQIYKVESSNLQTGKFSSLDGFGIAKITDEGDEANYVPLTQNYSKTWTQYKITAMEKITEEMRIFDKYDEINRVFRNLGNSVALKMERDMQHRLTMADQTSYTDNSGKTITTTVGDGFQLAYASHTVPGSSTTYRNIVANNPVLSKGGIEAAEKLFKNMIDDNGIHSPRTATHIITSNDPNTVNTAMEYLKSQADVTGSNSGVINAYNGKYTHIVLDFLNETPSTLAVNSSYDKYWFLADLKPMSKRGMMKVAVEPQLVPVNTTDIETGDWKYKARALYAIEWLDGKNIVMSLGNSTP